MRYIKAPLIILLAASLFQKLGQEVTLDRVTFHVSSSYLGPAQPPTSGWQPGGARLSVYSLLEHFRVLMGFRQTGCFMCQEVPV